MTLPYRANAWYWKVGDDNDQVFDSGRMQFVPHDDTAYNAWLDAGGVINQAPDGNALFGLLTKFVIPLVMETGVEVESTSHPSINGTYKLDQQSQNYLSGIAASIASGRGVPGGGSTFFYGGVEFNEDQFLDVATALMNYVYHYNLGLGTLLATNGAQGGIPETPLVID